MSDVIVSKTSPVSKKDGFTIFAEPLHLDEIPGAMDNMKWPIAAKLMRHWFSIKPAYAMPKAVRDGDVSPLTLPKTVINDSIVKLAWIKSFNSDSVLGAWLDLTFEWSNAKGKAQLKAQLKKAGWVPGSPGRFQFGNTNLSVVELDANHSVNFRPFGSMMDTMNDLYGAIGTGTYKAAVVGYVEKDEFFIEGLAFYMRDTYDFNDNPGFNPPLGIWSRDRVLSKAESSQYLTNPVSYTIRSGQGYALVENKDFRRWQKAQNTGGDFIVYSDVEWQPSTTSIMLW